MDSDYAGDYAPTKVKIVRVDLGARENPFDRNSASGGFYERSRRKARNLSSPPTRIRVVSGA